MIPTLETPRLILRPLSLNDVPAIQQHIPQWEILQYMPSIPWPFPADGAISFVRDRALPGMEQGNQWYWAICSKNNPGEFIGLISLTDKDQDDPKSEHRGFWLAKEFHRQGLMSEAAEKTADFWFTVLKKPLLRVGNATLNTASSRIKAKRGFRKIEEFDRSGRGSTLRWELWEITREEWLARHPAPTQPAPICSFGA